MKINYTGSEYGHGYQNITDYPIDSVTSIIFLRICKKKLQIRKIISDSKLLYQIWLGFRTDFYQISDSFGHGYGAPSRILFHHFRVRYQKSGIETYSSFLLRIKKVIQID